MKNHTDYPISFAGHSEYKTDRTKIKSSFLGRRLFYPRMIRIVAESNLFTKRNLYNRYNWVASSLYTIRAMEKAGLDIHVEGIDNLSKFEGPAVFVGNHMSTLETLALPTFIQPIKSVVYVIKEELARYPLFGAVAAARHPILVGRENPREDLQIVLNEGSARLQDDRSVIIFPQKTRSAFFDASSFNSLGIKLAKRNDVYVVPLALLTDAWENGKIVKEFGKLDTSKSVHFAFGEPFKVETNGTKENQTVIEFIQSKLKEWGRPEYVM
ncbi:MAG: lysophospholipid acyltransferase family protein [Melioribacteraceae bacterium]|nr:1-acyl-sn-glycerol-3-phosphate acyltransferase [Melioribacteraceae bacterium]WKZ70725.1 MAG: lysophospholipid acyltransferase family protein [Melioribacteraceae bacterium]